MDTECAIERVFATIEMKKVASLDDVCINNAEAEVTLLRNEKLNSNAEKTFKIVDEIVKKVSQREYNLAKEKYTKEIHLKRDFAKLLKKYLVKNNNKGGAAEHQLREEPEPDYDQPPNNNERSLQSDGQQSSRNIQDHAKINAAAAEEYDRQRGQKASQAMRHNNPDIADLSDHNRPTKIAERYTQFYDNEWTTAFEILSEKKKTEEKKITQLLLEIIEEAYIFTKKEAEKQILKMNSTIMNILESGDTKGKPSKDMQNDVSLLVQFRKQHAERSIKRLQANFAVEVRKMCTKVVSGKPPTDKSVMITYGNKAVELTWWMCVQDPPVYMVTSRDKFNPDFYRAYTKSGTIPDFYVWPPLKLHKSGGILAKGVVQYK
ncbi:uncharacterized protein LOC132757415 isoform X2 [Ruditapes philippinarum]|uniref:uncharacterized protein LOC132757415 isoform X2 n=1 Tax=Ruditapes philippinarum TaxID=129788 RepID=UPI00295B9020|nr:uncharacterized protein LOC132757415 isoform X2 [Ruditapes philippinarum]